MRHRVAKAIATVLSVVMTSVAFAPPVMAASCDPGRSAQSGTWFAGSEETDYQYVTGIWAAIYESDVYVNWTTNVPTSAWVMLNAGPGQLAQVGWQEQAFGNRHVFVQYRDNAGNYPISYWNPEPEDQWTDYKVRFRTGDDIFTFVKDGSTLVEVPASFDPSKSQVMGELKNLNNQMPGVLSNKEKFYDELRRKADEVTWVTFVGDNAGTSNNNYFTFENLGGGDIRVWDDC